MHNSLEYWRTTPSTAAALFSVEMPYRPPKSRVGAFLWRRRMWLETTMGLSVLEPWEKLMILVIFYLLITVTATGVYRFLPQQLDVLHSRTVYYFFGHEASQSGAQAVQQLVSGIANSTKEL
ncbi:hypothetical protein PsYK624_101570 [Phanerochaete sordida]|uniref:Uncharacterized protein n=1 Tax=Phanerochaete sordida TaxID=48140 RepID=A0A9P3GHX7_9APHY|nr:hypothetical protein PsYK624_101570 [Phanerochaete sordida]